MASFEWQDHNPTRVDRYLDWARVVDPGDGWCPVSIVVRQVDALDNLRQLQAQVESGATVKMTGPEKLRLDAAITNTNTSEWGRSYYVYMHESDVYYTGAYSDTAWYEIRFAGPPIAALNFAAMATPDRTGASIAPKADASVAIGIIDDGIGFANARLRKSEGRETRFTSLWLQDDETATDQDDIAFGRHYTAAKINCLLKNCALDEREVYRRTGQLDFSNGIRKPLSYRASHGTHIADLAAGANPSALPKHEALFAVQVPATLIADSNGASIGSCVLQALRHIMNEADEISTSLPLVVNLSFGNYAGPKDGWGLVENEIARLVRLRTASGAPTVVVMPAGNSFEMRTTARVRLDAYAPGSARTIDWTIRPDDHTANFLEIWVDLPNNDTGDDKTAPPLPLHVALTPPGMPNSPATPIKNPKDGQARLLHSAAGVVGAIYFDRVIRDNGPSRQRIFLIVGPTAALTPGVPKAPAGPWQVTLTNCTGVPLEAMAYIQRDDTPFGYYPTGRQSRFDEAQAYGRDPETGSYDLLDPEHGAITGESTLSAIGNGQGAILVGAAKGGACWTPADYTSSGPTVTRDGPDLAVGVDPSDILKGTVASGTLSGSTAILTGTSVAAPQVTRLIAHRLSQRGVGKTIPELLDFLCMQGSAPCAEDKARVGNSVLDTAERKIRSLPRRRYDGA